MESHFSWLRPPVPEPDLTKRMGDPSRSTAQPKAGGAQYEETPSPIIRHRRNRTEGAIPRFGQDNYVHRLSDESSIPRPDKEGFVHASYYIQDPDPSNQFGFQARYVQESGPISRQRGEPEHFVRDPSISNQHRRLQNRFVQDSRPGNPKTTRQEAQMQDPDSSNQFGFQDRYVQESGPRSQQRELQNRSNQGNQNTTHREDRIQELGPSNQRSRSQSTHPQDPAPSTQRLRPTTRQVPMQESFIEEPSYPRGASFNDPRPENQQFVAQRHHALSLSLPAQARHTQVPGPSDEQAREGGPRGYAQNLGQTSNHNRNASKDRFHEVRQLAQQILARQQATGQLGPRRLQFLDPEQQAQNPGLSNQQYQVQGQVPDQGRDTQQSRAEGTHIQPLGFNNQQPFLPQGPLGSPTLRTIQLPSQVPAISPFIWGAGLQNQAQPPDASSPPTLSPPSIFETPRLSPGFTMQNFMNKEFPRIPVTPSMLYTHAQMRGKAYGFDHMHNALYPAQNRDMFPHRVWLPHIRQSKSIEELPTGVVFFWDPLTPGPVQELPLQAPLMEGYQPPRPRSKSDVTGLTYQEFIERHPPSVGKNHYKGDEVYGNFGYVEANHKWVDPDSEGELHSAFMTGDQSPDRAKRPADFRGIENNGPRIMSQEEEDEFYREYVDEVTDDKDAEGDPRQYRISPATFARWATGAVPGDIFEETIFDPIAKLPPAAPHDIKSRKIKAEWQFDVETGSVISGQYEPEEEPSLLRSAQGVDIVRPPANFAYSFAHAAQDLENKAFGPAWQDIDRRGSYESSVASTPEPFVQNNIINNLGHPAHPETGVAEYIFEHGRINTLRKNTDEAYRRTLNNFNKASAENAKKVTLTKEVTFLKRKLDMKMPSFSNLFGTPTPEKEKKSKVDYKGKGKEIDWGDYDDVEEDDDNEVKFAEAEPVEAIEVKKQKKQYRRYFRETIIKEHNNLIREEVMAERFESEFMDTRNDIEKLEIEKKKLLGELGVETIDDIPGSLLPNKNERKKARERMNMEMKAAEGEF